MDDKAWVVETAHQRRQAEEERGALVFAEMLLLGHQRLTFPQHLRPTTRQACTRGLDGPCSAPRTI